jgi:hypothetical protein
MKEIQWKVWNSKFEAFDSSQGDFEDVPGWDIQVVAVRDERVGKRLHHHADYYIMVDGEWVGVDDTGLLDYLVNVLKIVKVGRHIGTDLFRQILRVATDDPDLPKKSGRLPDEPRD